MIGTAPFERPSSISLLTLQKHVTLCGIHIQLCFSHDYQTGVNLLTTVLFPILSNSVVDVAEEVSICTLFHLGARSLDSVVRVVHPELPPRRPRHLLLPVHPESPSACFLLPSSPMTSARRTASSPANSSTRRHPLSAPRCSATSASGSCCCSHATPTRRCGSGRFWRWVRYRTS